MSSETERAAERGRSAEDRSRERLHRGLRIALYALLYAGAVALLVIFAPSGPHVFIYQEF